MATFKYKQYPYMGWLIREKKKSHLINNSIKLTKEQVAILFVLFKKKGYLNKTWLFWYNLFKKKKKWDENMGVYLIIIRRHHSVHRRTVDGWMDVYPGNADDESMREEDLSFFRVSRSSSSLCCKVFCFVLTTTGDEEERRKKKTMIRFLYSSSR